MRKAASGLKSKHRSHVTAPTSLPCSSTSVRPPRAESVPGRERHQLSFADAERTTASDGLQPSPTWIELALTTGCCLSPLEERHPRTSVNGREQSSRCSVLGFPEAPNLRGLRARIQHPL